MNVFSNYLNAIENPEHKNTLEEVLSWVSNTFPSLESRIAWNQPMFTDHETFIIGFSVSKEHFAVAPETAGIDKFCDQITKAGYSHSSNIFRIKWKDPVQYSLLKQIIQFNIEDKAHCYTFWRK